MGEKAFFTRLFVRALITGDGLQDEREFLPAAIEIIDTPSSPVGRSVGGFIILAAVLALGWAFVGRVDIIVTSAGRLAPMGKTKVVQPLDSGVITAIRVNDGDHVRAGDVLLELDATETRADRDHFARDLMQALLDLARLNGLAHVLQTKTEPALVDPPLNASRDDIETTRLQMREQAAEQNAKLLSLDRQIAEKSAEAAETAASVERLKSSLPMVQGEVDIRTKLKDMEFGNRLTWLEASQRLTEQQHQIPVLRRHYDQSIATISAIQQERASTVATYERTILEDLTKTRTRVSELSAELAKAEEKLSLKVLRAPLGGMVQQLSIHTIGGVVTPAEPLLAIVPDEGGLTVETMVQNKDVGFVRINQPVQIKIAAFPFTRYGLIAGNVTSLSRDIVDTNNDTKQRRSGTQSELDNSTELEPSYVAHIALSRYWIDTEGGRVALTPGMAVTAEIQTGRRRIIDYLFSPLVKGISESMRER